MGLGLLHRNSHPGADLRILSPCVCVLSYLVMFDSVIPWTVAHQVLLSMEFSRKEYWSGLPFSSPGDLSGAGLKPASAASPVLPVSLMSPYSPYMASKKGDGEGCTGFFPCLITDASRV